MRTGIVSRFYDVRLIRVGPRLKIARRGWSQPVKWPIWPSSLIHIRGRRQKPSTRVDHRPSIHHDTEHNLKRCLSGGSRRDGGAGKESQHSTRPSDPLEGAESTRRLGHRHCRCPPVDTKRCTYPLDAIFKTTIESSAPYLWLIQYTMATVVISGGLTSGDLLRVSTRLHVNIVASDGIQRRIVRPIAPFQVDTGCIPPER